MSVALIYKTNHFQCQLYVTFKKYKTFSVLIYSNINRSGNWKKEKLCDTSKILANHGSQNTLYHPHLTTLVFLQGITLRKSCISIMPSSQGLDGINFLCVSVGDMYTPKLEMTETEKKKLW